MIQAPDEDSGPRPEELGNDGEESWCEALVRGNDAPKITWRKADAASQESSSSMLPQAFVCWLSILT